MNFHVDDIAMPCCIISVEETENGYGEIRIVTANQKYRDTMGPAYHDGMLYYELVPQDNKFEDFCYQSAVKGRRMHAYVETVALDCWTDQTLIPLTYKNGNLHYCEFLFEFTKIPEAQRRASISVEASEAVISACIRLMQKEDFYECMNDVTEEIMNTSGAKSCRIMAVDNDKKEATILCEKSVPNYWPEHSIEDDVITYDLIKDWGSAIGVSNELIIKNEADMNELALTHPAWVNSMRNNGVNSLILDPLKREGTIIGYLYVVNYDLEKTVVVKEMIELLSFFLGIWITNHQLLAKLQEMSTIDALTGLNNRYALAARIKALVNRPFAVINLDVNGLKEVNDTDGHDAGDKLLTDASDLLKSVFDLKDIYRTGGDEFVVIIDDIDEITLNNKLLEFYDKQIEDGHVSFAVGFHYSMGDEDVETVLRMADKHMYEDKELYYKRKSFVEIKG